VPRRYHRRCTGRWRGELNLGKDGQGRRRHRKVSATSKAELLDKLAELQAEVEHGARTSRTYTVAEAVDEWLAGPMADQAPKTIATQREILAPLTEEIGQAVLRDLQADDVSKALGKIAVTRSTRTVRDTRASLVRVITYAQARGKVTRNVAMLIKAPQGQSPGRPSKALTVDQALAVLKAAEDDRLRAYFVLSLLTGVRTEEARALRWDHVHLNERVPYIDVWMSVRAGGDVKTRDRPGGRWRCPSVPLRPWKSTLSCRSPNARSRPGCGASMAWYSPPSSAGRWTRRMYGDRFGGSARQQKSGRTGRLGSCGTASCRSCRTVACRSSGSPTSLATRAAAG
jgi:hypothetical protein